MPKVETLKIVSDSDRGFTVINADDFDEETMELAEDQEPPVSESVDGDEPTKEELEIKIKETSDEEFNLSLEDIDASGCKKILDKLEVEYNKNLGVKKLREAVASARADLIAA